jgi:hypothetical protein
VSDVRPVLGDLELPQVQQVTSFDRRALTEHVVAGLDATVVQNLGRTATRLLVTGVATGDQARRLTESLGTAVRTATPTTFVADVTADAHLEHVVVCDLSLDEIAGRPERFAYRITLREYTEPPPPPDPVTVEADILADAAGLVEGLTVGLDAAAGFAAELAAATAGLGDLLARLQHLKDAAGTG